MNTTAPTRPVQPAPARQAPSWPKPRLIWQHRDLFQEPAYPNGWTPTDDDEDD